MCAAFERNRCRWAEEINLVCAPSDSSLCRIGGAREATRFVALGINALLATSSDASIRMAVEATQSLLSRGVGECGRVPVATLVRIDAQGKTLTGITKNVGYGGMAVRLFRNAALPQEIIVNFVAVFRLVFT